MHLTDSLSSASKNDHSKDLFEEITSLKIYKPGKNQFLMVGKNIGRWDQTQKIKYLQFLKDHKHNIVKKSLRRTDKIFKQMSKYIQTRAADQCRSHHQKMEKKHRSFEGIVEALSKDSNLQKTEETFKMSFSEKTKGNVSQIQEIDHYQQEKLVDEFEQNDIFMVVSKDGKEKGESDFSFSQDVSLDWTVNSHFEIDYYFGI